MKVSRALSQKIFERDKFLCRNCGASPPPYYDVKWGDKTVPECLVVDHLVPGGGNDGSNLQTLCHKCNSSKAGRSQEQFDIFRSLQILGRPVAFYPSIAAAVGIKESLFLCQLIYWTPRARNDKGPGWIYKSAEEMCQETGLSYKEQLRARQGLCMHGILEEKYERTTHRMYFKVNPDAISRVIVPYQREGGHIPIGKVAPPQREVRDMPDGNIVKGTETTTETTHKTKPAIAIRFKQDRIRTLERILREEKNLIPGERARIQNLLAIEREQVGA